MSENLDKLTPERKLFNVMLDRGDASNSTAMALYYIHWKMTTSYKGFELFQGWHCAGLAPYSLELYCEDQTLAQCYSTTGPGKTTIGAFLNTINPYIEIREIPDYFENLSDEGMFAVGTFTYGYWDIYPSEDFGPVAVAPMQPILQAMQQVPPEFKVYTQLAVQHNLVRFQLHLYLWFWRQVDRVWHWLRPKYWFKKGEIRKTQIEKITEKAAKRKWTRTAMRIAVVKEGKEAARGGRALQEEMRRYLDQILAGYAMQSLQDLNWYKWHSIKFGKKALRDMAQRKIPYWRPSVPITVRELAGWWTIPTFDGLNFRRVLARELAPPIELPSPELIDDPSKISYFGKTTFRRQQMPFGILREDRNKHCFILGNSGTGKSKLLELLMREDIKHGFGCGLIDPTGALIDTILRHVPENRIDDVIVFDPSDVSFPASLNPFELVDDRSRMRVAAGLLEMFKLRFSESWSDKLEHLLLQTILALLSTKWTTVLSMRKMILEKEYREAVIPNIKDYLVKNFWENEYPIWEQKHQEDVIEPMLRLVGNFVANEMIRNTLGQPFNKFDFREIIDSGKILLMKISARELGEDNAALLGAMIVTRIYQAAMSRADVPFEERKDFYLYVDEFEEFATTSFEEVLSESRKYKLNLTLSNQNLSLLPKAVRNSIFGNVGSIISFRTSADDAPTIETEFHPKVEASDIRGLSPRNFYMKMSVQGKAQRVFSGKTIDIDIPRPDFLEQCVESSREKYCLPKDQVVDIINTWGKVG